jgi:hypothetical protein
LVEAADGSASRQIAEVDPVPADFSFCMVSEMPHAAGYRFRALVLQGRVPLRPLPRARRRRPLHPPCIHGPRNAFAPALERLL